MKKLLYTLAIVLPFVSYTYGQTALTTPCSIEPFMVGASGFEFGGESFTGDYANFFTSNFSLGGSCSAVQATIATSCPNNSLNTIEYFKFSVNGTEYMYNSSNPSAIIGVLLIKPCPGEFIFNLPDNIFIQDGDEIRCEIKVCKDAGTYNGPEILRTGWYKPITINHKLNVQNVDLCNSQSTFNFTYEDRVIVRNRTNNASIRVRVSPLGQSGQPFPGPNPLNYFTGNYWEGGGNYPSPGVTMNNVTSTYPSTKINIASSVNYLSANGAVISPYQGVTGKASFQFYQGQFCDAQYGFIKFVNENANGNNTIQYANGFGSTENIAFSPNETLAFADSLDYFKVDSDSLEYRLFRSNPLLGTNTLLKTIAKKVVFTCSDPAGVFSNSTNYISDTVHIGENVTLDCTNCSSGQVQIIAKMGTLRIRDTIDVYPGFNITSPPQNSQICSGQSLTGQVPQGITGTWSSLNPTIAAVTSVGGIISDASNGAGGTADILFTQTGSLCKDTVRVSINPRINGNITALNNDYLCFGTNTATLTCQSCTTPLTWTFPNSTTTSTTVFTSSFTQPGKYYVSSVDANNCPFRDSIVLITSTLNPTISGAMVICPSEQINVSASGADVITWLSNNNFVGSQLLQVGPGTYTAEFEETASGCKDTLSTIITDYSVGKTYPKAVNDTIWIIGDETTGSISYTSNDIIGLGINASMVSDYTRNSHTFTSNESSYTLASAAKFMYEDSLIYKLEDPVCPNDMFDIATINVQVLPIPQLITPTNKDGKNDTWDIHFRPSEDIEVIIMNRWGDVVYKTTNYNNDWSGESNTGIFSGKKDAVGGTYYYVINIKKLDKVIKGYLELVK